MFKIKKLIINQLFIFQTDKIQLKTEVYKLLKRKIKNIKIIVSYKPIVNLNEYTLSNL